MMRHLRITKGLDIPFDAPKTRAAKIVSPEVALDFTFFQSIRPHVLVQEGDRVALGQPLVEEKGGTLRYFPSPASGLVKEVRRGEKRVLRAIVIHQEGDRSHPLPSEEDPMLFLSQSGLLSWIWMRPFHLPAHPHLAPRSIFIKALETAPLTVPSELQIEGREAEFQAGLQLLARIAPVHLICRQGSPFTSFEGVEISTVEGPHPAANPSVHIHFIDPIKKSSDVVWSLDAWAVAAIGHARLRGRLLAEKWVSTPQGFALTPLGASISAFSLPPGTFISGDPLTGMEVGPADFLLWHHSTILSIPPDPSRKLFHFLRLGTKNYTATGTYLSPKKPLFSNRLHGEERAFVDPNIYDRVMPMRVPTVPLVKAILAEDFQTAEKLGILEIASEDFALATFICPSKIEIAEIIEKGLKRFVSEYS
jgi:Na+-transporting NADH:ubiquinone oxidoreductase subunit A